MLKRRGNFPYDFDAAYPAYPTPVMPPGYYQNSTPPPAAPPELQPAPPPPETASPLTASEPIVTPPPPQPEAAAPIPKPRRPHRRTRPKPASPNYPTAPVSDPNESPASRHSRVCSICNHPEREAIDADFVDWVDAFNIAFDHGVQERAVWRHARATGLYPLRRSNYRIALDCVIEHARNVTVTGDTIIRAIRAASSITESGQWVEQPKRVIFSFEHLHAPAIAPSHPAPPLPPPMENPVLELAPPIIADPVLLDSEKPSRK